MLNFDTQLELRVIKTWLELKPTTFHQSLKSDHFGSSVGREIWGRLALLRSRNKPLPSLITLINDPVLTPETKTTLENLDLPSFEPTETPSALDQLDVYRQGRAILSMMEKVKTLMTPNDPKMPSVKEAIQNALSQLTVANLEDQFLRYNQAAMDEVLEFHEKTLDQKVEDVYMPTGFKFIDDLQGGLARKRLYVMGARSGGGKSILANCLITNTYMLMKKFRGCYVSLEMGREECHSRTQAYISRIPAERFNLFKLSPDERKLADKTLVKFLNLTPDKSLDYWAAGGQGHTIQSALDVLEPQNYDMIVLDYLTLFKNPDNKKQEWQNIGDSCQILKEFAVRNNCVVILLSQIDPDQKKLKYASAIEFHSDGVWMWGPDEKEKAERVYEITQTKLRNFGPKKFNLKEEFDICSFSEEFGAGAQGQTPVQQMIAPMKLR